MKKKVIRISPRIQEDLYERLKNVALEENRSPVQQLECFIKNCLENYLTQHEVKHA